MVMFSILSNRLQSCSRSTSLISCVVSSAYRLHVSARLNCPDVDKSRLNPHVVHVRTAVGRCAEKPSGLNFDVTYLDILPRGCSPENKLSMSVILYLAGYIGSHKPVRHFLLKLADKTGCRVLAPLWPGLCDETRPHSSSDSELFGHTISEYSEFTADFLTAVDVAPHKLPLVSIVAHSGGCHPALVLGARSTRFTKSLALICPSAPRPLSKFGYEWVHRFVAKTWDIKATRPIIRPVISAGVFFSPFRGFLSTEAAASVARATLRVQRSEVLGAATDVLHKQIPLLFVYSDIDEWIPLADSLTLAEHLELHPDSKKGRRATERYSISGGKVEKLPQLHHEDVYSTIKLPRNALRIVKGGSHWPQRNCPDLVLDKISNLLQYI